MEAAFLEDGKQREKTELVKAALLADDHLSKNTQALKDAWVTVWKILFFANVATSYKGLTSLKKSGVAYPLLS